jgi:N-acyl-D-amino-acid deacylase
MAFDTIIQGGRVVDGTGNPWFWADVGIAGDKISAVGDLSAAEAQTTLDASGLVVCPGFIDIHTHSDRTLLVNPRAESMVRQGVTTQVTGNCGFSSAPCTGEREGEWLPLGEYLDRLTTSGVSTNVAALIGHGQVREAVLGSAGRAPSDEERAEMRDQVARAMEDGAYGLSSGLAYAPGLFADADELADLARVVARYGGMYATHIRDESSQRAWRRSVQEAIQVGEQGGLPVQISHLESHYPNWGGEEEILALLEEARAPIPMGRGLDVSCDIPPYVCGATALTTILPNWAHEGGPPEIARRLRDPGERERIRQFVLTQREQQANPPPTMLADGLGDHIWLAGSEGHPDLVGLSLAEVGERWGKDPIDAAFDLIVADRATTDIVVEHHNEEDIRALVRHPLSMIVSDGAAYAPYGALGAERPHPRSYGVFPLVYRKYVRGETRPEEPREVGAPILTLQEAVRKMTSFPAQKLGLRDRGLVREGMWADLVLLDPSTVEDRATYEAPHQYPQGIPYVLVNGTLVVDRGEHTGALPGKVLRK